MTRDCRFEGLAIGGLFDGSVVGHMDYRFPVATLDQVEHALAVLSCANTDPLPPTDHYQWVYLPARNPEPSIGVFVFEPLAAELGMSLLQAALHHLVLRAVGDAEAVRNVKA